MAILSSIGGGSTGAGKIEEAIQQHNTATDAHENLFTIIQEFIAQKTQVQIIIWEETD